MATASMDAMADRFAAQGVGSVFLYTNEAHPGEHYPHLASMEQKFEHAKALREVYGLRRRILLDSLEGDAHLAFGSMPNMTWVFNRAGTVLYKSDWTDAHSVEASLEYYLDVQQRRKDGERLMQFRVERVDFRDTDRERFFEGLRKAGPKAETEFREAF